MNKQATKQHLDWIDALKGIAMILILMIHTDAGARLPKVLSPIGYNGWVGVVIFFLISSFLLYKSLHNYFCQTPYSFKSIHSWIKKKFFHFIPLFYLALLFGIYMGGNKTWIGSELTITVYNIITHLFFAHGLFPRYSNSILGVEWYIGTLALFIWIIPFLFKYINTLTRSILAFLISIPTVFYINSYLINLTYFSNPIDLKVYNSFIKDFCIFENLPTLFLGIVLYYIFKYITTTEIKNKKILSYLLLLISVVLIYDASIFGNHSLFIINTHTLWSITFSIFIISQILYQNKIICNNFFKVIGRYSWPIYLFHLYLIYAYKKYLNFSFSSSTLNWSIEFVFVLISSLALAYGLTRFVNSPILNWLSLKNKK